MWDIWLQKEEFENNDSEKFIHTTPYCPSNPTALKKLLEEWDTNIKATMKRFDSAKPIGFLGSWGVSDYSCYTKAVMDLIFYCIGSKSLGALDHGLFVLHVAFHKNGLHVVFERFK